MRPSDGLRFLVRAAEEHAKDEALSLVPAKPYRITDQFSVGDVVDHPTLGRGTVESVEGKKVKVRFARKLVLLAHAKLVI